MQGIVKNIKRVFSINSSSVGGSSDLQTVTDNGNTTTNTIESTGFIVTNGTDQGFLKADGTIDTTNYKDKGHFINSPIALGDSFTLGTGASPIEESYINKLSAINNVTIQNQGIGGVGVWRETSQHFQVCLSQGNINPTTWMVGFNDLRRAGNNSSTYEKIKGCLKSCIINTWLQEFKAANTVTNTGTWSNDSGYGGKCEGLSSGSARKSSTIGDTLTYISPISSNIVIGTFSTDGIIKDYGRFTVSIDGTIVETYNPNGKTDGISDGAYDNNVTQNVLFYENLKNTTHTVIITLLDSKQTVIDYFAVMSEPNINPAFFVIDIPQMTTAGFLVAPANASTLILDLGTEAQKEVIALFPYRPTIRVNLDGYFNLSTDISGDNVHPNNLGHTHIALAVQSTIIKNTDLLINGRTSETSNTILGDGASSNISIGIDGNTVYGKDAMKNSTIARQCIAIGQESMKNASGASDYNTFTGYQSGMSLVTSTNNTGYGFGVLKSFNGVGSQHTIFGHNAARSLLSNYNNSVFGALAMQSATSAGFNAIFGTEAYKTGNGSQNSIFGYGAGANSTGAGNVFLGFSAGANENGSNLLYIANSNTSSPLIYGDFGTSYLKFNASKMNLSGLPTTNSGVASGEIYFDTAANALANGDLVAIRKT